MNVRKKYPKLFRNLARRFGARKAKYILLELNKNPEVIDTHNLVSAITWGNTVQGHKYWSEIQKEYDPNWAN